jgi:hypothetical protein
LKWTTEKNKKQSKSSNIIEIEEGQSENVLPRCFYNSL